MVRKILFVDDDSILQIAMEKSLSILAENFIVEMASDGFEAVKKLEEISFSLVVVDLVMPRMDGMSLIGHIHEKYPDLPVVIISGMAETEIKNIAKSAGVLAYLKKPFQVDRLVSIIMDSLKKEADGGIMNDVSPTVFLQLMEMDVKTCTIRIIDTVSKEAGVLFFVEGELLDARVGALRGIEAAYKVFTWDVVTIFIGNECALRENKINSQLQPIIMKAVGLKDESDGESLGFDPGEKLFESDLFDTPLESTDIEENDTMKSRSTVRDIQELLEKKLGKDWGLKDIYHDGNMERVVTLLAKIGDTFDFGNIEAGCTDNGKKAGRMFLPGRRG